MLMSMMSAPASARAPSEPASPAGELDRVQADPLALRTKRSRGIAFGEPFARDHFRDDEAGAKARRHLAEREIGDARHGGEQDAVRQTVRADRETVVFSKAVGHVDPRNLPIKWAI
jgi:hypothetical protein